MTFNRNTIRMGLGLIAAFYVVVGGLFLLAYIPVARLNAAAEANLKSDHPYDYSGTSMQDALNYDINSVRAHRYGTLLLWGTLGLGVFGGVVVMTRPKKAVEAAS